MESEDTEVDKKTNICPICERSFSSMAGLRQHVTKSHSEEEIMEAIANKTNSDSQLSQATSAAHTPWNKFQIIEVDDRTNHTNNSKLLKPRRRETVFFRQCWNF